jgi:hypothetical protein
MENEEITHAQRQCESSCQVSITFMLLAALVLVVPFELCLLAREMQADSSVSVSL